MAAAAQKFKHNQPNLALSRTSSHLLSPRSKSFPAHAALRQRKGKSEEDRPQEIRLGGQLAQPVPQLSRVRHAQVVRILLFQRERQRLVLLGRGQLPDRDDQARSHYEAGTFRVGTRHPQIQVPAHSRSPLPRVASAAHGRQVHLEVQRRKRVPSHSFQYLKLDHLMALLLRLKEWFILRSRAIKLLIEISEREVSSLLS